jgi:hypothetical protein
MLLARLPTSMSILYLIRDPGGCLKRSSVP